LREITRGLASEARTAMKWRRSGAMSAGEEDPIALLAAVSEKRHQHRALRGAMESPRVGVNKFNSG
jgi:hypothetical protein